MLRRSFLEFWTVLLLAVCFNDDVWAQTLNPPAKSGQELALILDYIASGWNLLTRSTTTCQAAPDPKLTDPAVLYFPSDLGIPAELPKLLHDCNVRVEQLPAVIRGPGQVTGSGIRPPGLLYL